MRTVVFDLDGTLVDSARGIAVAVNKALAEMFSAPLSEAEVTSFIGNGVPVLIEKVTTAARLPLTRREALLETFRRYYDADPGAELFTGVVDCLDTLRADGVRIGLCTNKPEAPTFAILDELGIRDYFAAVVGGDSGPLRKPDPAPLRITFDRLGGTGIYVGDSEVDATCADRAGIPFYLFTEGYRQTPADKLVHAATFSDFRALPAMLRKAA